MRSLLLVGGPIIFIATHLRNYNEAQGGDVNLANTQS